MGRRLFGVGLAVVTALVLVMPASASASITNLVNLGPVAPSYPSDFPDPDVVWDAGTGLYWAYSTEVGATTIPVISSTDLTHWSAPVNAIPTLPAWVTPGSSWAPSVARFGSTWVMWYTTREASSGRQCLSVATATGPGGPYVDHSTAPAICQLTLGGSIDANVFVSGGSAYLIWKADSNALNEPTSLWSAPLTAAGTAVSGTGTRLLTEDASWQAPVVEGPTMIVSGRTYYLFYGANNWDSSSAAIGYATCSGPLGPCRDATLKGPWLGSYGSALGPSGPDVFVDRSGAVRLAFHAWYRCVGYPSCGRDLWIGHLGFVLGIPVLTP